MNTENVKKWGTAAGVRAVKTAAQVGVVLIGSDIVNIATLDWPYIAGCMAAAAVLSILTSIAGVPEVEKGTSPLAKEE